MSFLFDLDITCDNELFVLTFDIKYVVWQLFDEVLNVYIYVTV